MPKVQLSTAALVPLVPVVFGAVALGRVVFESGEAERRAAGVEPGHDVGAVLAGLTAIALFLLSLGALPDLAARAFLGLLAGALWLAARARRDPRLAPLFFLTAGLLAGAELRLGLALAPALAAVLFVARGSVTTRLRGPLLLLVGALAGALIARHALLRTLSAPRMLDARSLGTWALDSGRHTGVMALAFGIGGLLLALVAGGARRLPALSACVLCCVDAATGAYGEATALALALAVGLGLMEARLRLARLALPGVSMALVPLVFLTLFEPLGARLGERSYTWPSLGPVPPRELPSTRTEPAGAPAPTLRRAPARNRLADTVRR